MELRLQLRRSCLKLVSDSVRKISWPVLNPLSYRGSCFGGNTVKCFNCIFYFSGIFMYGMSPVIDVLIFQKVMMAGRPMMPHHRNPVKV